MNGSQVEYGHVHFHLRYQKTHQFPSKAGSAGKKEGLCITLWFLKWFWWGTNHLFLTGTVKILDTNFIKEKVYFAAFLCTSSSHCYLIFMHRRVYAFWLAQIITVELIWTPLWFYILSTHNVCSPDFGDAVISGLLTQPGIAIRGWTFIQFIVFQAGRWLSHLHTNNSAILFHKSPSLCSEDLTSPITIHHLGRTVEAFWSVKSLAVAQFPIPYVSMNAVPGRTSYFKKALHNVGSQSKMNFLSASTHLFTGSDCHKRSPGCSNYATYF